MLAQSISLGRSELFHILTIVLSCLLFKIITIITLEPRIACMSHNIEKSPNACKFIREEDKP
jgi:hypothetical protein